MPQVNPQPYTKAIVEAVSPVEIAQRVERAGIAKIQSGTGSTFALAVMAGALIIVLMVYYGQSWVQEDFAFAGPAVATVDAKVISPSRPPSYAAFWPTCWCAWPSGWPWPQRV